VITQDNSAIVALEEQIKKPLWTSHPPTPNHINAKGLTLAHQKDTIGDIYMTPGYSPPPDWAFSIFDQKYAKVIDGYAQDDVIPNYASQII
jgi:hypothetical protein